MLAPNTISDPNNGSPFAHSRAVSRCLGGQDCYSGRDRAAAALAVHSQSPPTSPASPLSPLGSSPASSPTTAKPLRHKERPRLLSYDEIPKWYQDNEFIRHGYRPVSCSARVSFASWLYLHNESVNIFSHLIPAVGFLLGEWYIQDYLYNRYSRVTASDHIIFAFFLLAATVCLSFSATYHTMINHSHRIESLWLRLDLVGIVVLTLGDFVSGIYLAFWCEPLQRKIYWSMISTLGALTIFILLSPKFRGPKWRTFRVMTFVCTGLSGLAPLGHGIQMFGFVLMLKQSGMPYYLAEGALLALGAFLYATKLPESRFPGKFDIYGSSHQLFHVLVVIATVVHLVGILEAFDYNYHHRMCPVR